MVAGGRTGARRRREGRGNGGLPAEVAGPAGAFLELVVRALGLERAALLLERSPGALLVPVATHGVGDLPPCEPDAEPPGGPWTLALPLRSGLRVAGMLLLAPRGGVALPPADVDLASRMAEAAALLLEHAQLAADLVRAHELLARADRLSALGTLAAGVAHEIRNPLVSVRTFIQLLPERLGDQEFRTTFRDLALGEVERICGLINDLLAFARPAPAQVEPTDLNELVGQIVRLLDAEARRRGVVVACMSDPALPLVTVDEAQVKQVLMNVILNAIEACAARGRVEITTRTDESGEESSCVVAVADSGRGIAPEHLEQIFDPFFTTKDAGSGLGLFVAHEIVTHHGGGITAAPRAEGGTVFTIHFPVRASRPQVDVVAG